MDGPMTTTEQDLRALAYLAQRLRTETHGAAKWDHAGLWPVLKRLEGHNLALTIERVTRHAADPDARTPAAIERPFVPEAPKATGVRYPPKAADECRLHPGEWATSCRACAGDALAGDPKRPTRAPRTGDYSERVAELRAAMRGETA